MSAPLRVTTPALDDDEAWGELRRRFPRAPIRTLLLYLDELKRSGGSGSPAMVWHNANGNVVRIEVLRGATAKVWIPER